MPTMICRELDQDGCATLLLMSSNTARCVHGGAQLSISSIKPPLANPGKMDAAVSSLIFYCSTCSATTIGRLFSRRCNQSTARQSFLITSSPTEHLQASQSLMRPINRASDHQPALLRGRDDLLTAVRREHHGSVNSISRES
jgi:hypothetical protein